MTGVTSQTDLRETIGHQNVLNCKFWQSELLKTLKCCNVEAQHWLIIIVIIIILLGSQVMLWALCNFSIQL